MPWRQTFRIVFNAIIFLLLALALLVFLFPRLTAYDLLTVLSPSMSPAIPVGAVVAIQPVSPGAIRPGDVITFRSPEVAGRKVTHRVVEISAEGGEWSFRTQGDANDAPDLAPVPSQALVGRVAFSVPYLGYAIQFARKPLGLLLLVFLPALGIVLNELGGMWQELRRHRLTR